MPPRNAHPIATLAATTAIILAGLTGCAQARGDADGTGTTSTTRAGTATTQHTPTPTTPAPTSTTLTAEEQAYQKAEQAYRAFAKSYAAAAVNFDPSKLDKSTITPELLPEVVKDLKQVAPAKKGQITGRWTQHIKSVTGVSYVPGTEVRLQICAVTNDRFIDPTGKDVTVTRDGKPAKPITTARQNQIPLKTSDNGKTWKVNTFVTSGEVGIVC